MSEERIKIYDQSDLKKYRTEIPNTIIKGNQSKGLSVYAKFLYIYLKSVAGENGECWQSTRTLSEGTGMAGGTISKCKKELAAAELINIKQGDHKKGQSDVITINDIWGKNMVEYATQQTPSSDEHPCSLDERTPSSDELPCSPDEPKKEPYNQERTLEEERAPEAPRLFGVPVPAELQQTDGFEDAFTQWREYLKQVHNRYPNIYSIQQQYNKLVALAKDGHRPVAVIRQSIEHEAKSFYPIREGFSDGSEDRQGSGSKDTNKFRQIASA